MPDPTGAGEAACESCGFAPVVGRFCVDCGGPPSLRDGLVWTGTSVWQRFWRRAFEVMASGGYSLLRRRGYRGPRGL